jgi:hypothetical protein
VSREIPNVIVRLYGSAQPGPGGEGDPGEGGGGVLGRRRLYQKNGIFFEILTAVSTLNLSTYAFCAENSNLC